MKSQKSSLNLIAIGAATSLATSSAGAVVLAEFKFDASSLASTDPSTSWSTTNISNGPGVPMTVAAGQGNPAPGIQITFGDFDNGNLAGALAAGDYYAFTVTPGAGQQITFSDFTWDFFKTANAGATISGTLFSSIDGFSTTGDAIGSDTLLGGGESGSFFARSISLGSLPANVTTATEFRLYLDDGNASNNANQLRLDNIVLNGSVTAIPEPSAAILLGLGALGVTARRRRG